MAISIDSFRAFVGGSIGDRKTVNFGDKAKSTLSTTRFSMPRELSSRQIVKLETAQDNNFVRIQLLTAVGDALGSVDNDYFQEVRARLFGSATHVDEKIASKPLTVREVRQVLSGLDTVLGAKATRANFEREMGRVFSISFDRVGRATDPRPSSARFQETVRRVLLPIVDAELSANPKMTLEELTGEHSAFGVLKNVGENGGVVSVTRLLLKAELLPATARTAFLRAFLMFKTAFSSGLDTRLQAVATELAALKPKDFTPYNIFSLAFPDTAWPKGVSKKATELSSTERNAITDAWTGNVSNRVLDGSALPELAPDDRSTYYAACTLMVDAGMKREDVLRVLKNPDTFTPEMIPRAGWTIGDQRDTAGVDSAFRQLVADLVRTHTRIEINLPSGRSVSASDAIHIKDHPLQDIALQNLRHQIEELCGPGASDSMKVNIYLAMSQNGMSVDGMLRPLYGLGTGGTKGYVFTLSRDDAGNVVVSRSMSGKRRAYVLESYTIHPDGRTELTKPPRFVVRKDETPAMVAEEEARDLTRAEHAADNDLEAYVAETYGKDFAKLFEGEIAEVEARFPACDKAKGAYPMIPGNLLSGYLSHHPDEARTFLKLSGEEVHAALLEMKERLLPNIRAAILKRALMENGCHEAERALAAAATLEGRAVNLEGVRIDTAALQEKMTYITLDDDHLDETSIRTALNAVRDRFVEARLRVLDIVKNLSGEEAALREELLRDALAYPNVGSEAYALALDIARSLPLPEISAAPMGEAEVKAALRAIGEKLHDTYSRLDTREYGAVQKGNMNAMIVTYLLKMRRPEILNLFGHLEAGAATRLMHELEPSDESVTRVREPEVYRDYMTRTYALTIFQPILREFDLD